MSEELEKAYTPPAESFPEGMRKEAFHGIAGEIVSAALPKTEACKEALLAQFLVGFGNLIGRNVHQYIGNSKHHCNEFTAIVGDTAFARKGTSWDVVKELLFLLDDSWKKRTKQGIPSGEAIIHHVRDARWSHDGEKALLDEGVEDKRLLLEEEEFARFLKLIAAGGNILSPVMRVAWNGPEILANSGKKSPDESTGAHISAIFHATRHDLMAGLSVDDSFNGFANRILWVASMRWQKLSRPPRIVWENEGNLVSKLRECASLAMRKPIEVNHSDCGAKAYDEFYQSQEDIDGVIGGMTKRSATHVERLAMIYSALDKSLVIKKIHIDAAVAFVEYCENTVRWLFGSSTGDRKADALLWALRREEMGLSRTEISKTVFSKNATKSEIEQVLMLLKNAKLVGVHGKKGSNDSEIWYAIEHQETALRRKTDWPNIMKPNTSNSSISSIS